MSFYQRYWDLIKQDLSPFFDEVDKAIMDLSRINYAYIYLIPKKQDSRLVKDYMMICLANGIMKIFTKVLSMRLSTYLDSLIVQTQSTFIKERQINDSFRCASEIVHNYNENKDRGLIYKLDYEKVFDNIN